MLKISGVILCLAGCTGYGILQIIKWNHALDEIREWLLLFRNMRNQIYYQRNTLEEICCRIRKENYGLAGEYVYRIGDMTEKKREMSFAQNWKYVLNEWRKVSSLSLRLKEKIMEFTNYIGEADYEAQISHIDMYIMELEEEKRRLTEQIYEKKKPIMAISICGGVVISLLFL